SKGCHGLVHRADGFAGVRHISRDGHSPAIQGFHLPFHILRKQVVSRETAYRDIGAAESELKRRSGAYATAPAGYQANLSFEFHFVLVTPLKPAIGRRRGPREGSREFL